MEGVTMRNLTLGGLLVVTSAAAIAYVYTNPTSGTCQTRSAEAVTAVEETSGCTACKPGVVDVVDLNTAYPVATALAESTISFDEPPLAKPRGDILPAAFELPASEIAPAPRRAD